MKKKSNFKIKLISTPMVVAIGGQGYQQYRVRNATNHGWVDSPYGPITLPNSLPEFFFEKAMIEDLGGGTEMTQTQFTAGSTGGATENYQYTTIGAA